MLRQLFRLLILCAFPLLPASAEGLKIALIGDSTVCNYPDDIRQRGWGQMLPEFLVADTLVINQARGGLSTKTYPADLWRRVRDAKPDFILIQFGHNDSHARDKPESTDAATDYQENLRRFVREAREIGASPILVTPVRRRLFQANGELSAELQPYADAMKIVASQMAVPIVDLHALSGELYKKLGEDASIDFTMNHEDLADRTGKGDRTHFTGHGAREMARLVAASLGGIDARLADAVKNTPTD